jgi:hypothetical protein
MIKSDRPSLARAARRCGMAAPVLVLVLAACGSSGGQPAGAASPPPAARPGDGATFHGTIYVSGVVRNRPTTWHVLKSFTQRVATVQNCAAAARYGMATGIFRVPSPAAPLPVANIEVTGFRGPGTYPPPLLKRDKSDTISLGQTTGMQRGTYVITTSARGAALGKEVLVLNKDGSGQLDYSEAHLNGSSGSPALAGVILWKCTS